MNKTGTIFNTVKDIDKWQDYYFKSEDRHYCYIVVLFIYNGAAQWLLYKNATLLDKFAIVVTKKYCLLNPK